MRRFSFSLLPSVQSTSCDGCTSCASHIIRGVGSCGGAVPAGVPGGDGLIRFPSYNVHRYIGSFSTALDFGTVFCTFGSSEAERCRLPDCKGGHSADRGLITTGGRAFCAVAMIVPVAGKRGTDVSSDAGGGGSSDRESSLQ